MMYKKRNRWAKPLAVMGLILYTICAGIGCGWVMVKLIEVIG